MSFLVFYASFLIFFFVFFQISVISVTVNVYLNKENHNKATFFFNILEAEFFFLTFKPLDGNFILGLNSIILV